MSSGVGKAERSWTHMTNSHNANYYSDSPSNVLLDMREGEEHRWEAVNLDNGLVTPRTWDELTDGWRDYVEDKKTAFLEIADANGYYESFVKPSSHRFNSEYMRKQYALIKGWEREAARKWGEENLTAVMVTLTASPRRGKEWVPPVEFQDELLEGWDAAYSRLYNVFGVADEYAYCRMMEPHKNGYPHLHIGILTPQDVEPEDFQGLINSHLKNCDLAGKEAHQILSREEQERRRVMAEEGVLPDEYKKPDGKPEMGCVSVRDADSEQAGLGSYLGAYLSQELDTDDPLDAPDHVQRFWALMWATERRRFQMSQRAREMADEDWERRSEEEDSDHDLDREEEVAVSNAEGEPDWYLKGLHSLDESPEESTKEAVTDAPGNFFEVDASGGSKRERYALDFGIQRRIADTGEPWSELTLELNPDLRGTDKSTYQP